MDSLGHREQRSSNESRLGDSANLTLSFFERYAGAVYAFFSRRGFTAEQCRELTQETFVGLDRQRDEAADERDEIRLFKVAAQIWHNATRGPRGSEQPGRQSATLAELEARRSGVGSPDAATLASPAWRRMQEAVAALPGPARRALLFQIDQELGENQIAILLQVSLTTVKTHLRNARQRLRTLLGEDEFGALEPSLRELVAETRRQLGHSGSRVIHVGNLVAYHEGTLAEDERERLQELLAYSPRWSQLLLDLDHFPDVVPPSGVEPLVGEALLEQREILENRLEDLEGPTRVLAFRVSGESSAVEESEEAEAWAWSSRLAILLLLAVIIGLGLWIAALHQKVAELSLRPPAPPLFEPLTNAKTHELFPRSARESGIAVRLSKTISHLLVLNSLDRGGFADYRIDLVAVGGTDERISWQGSGFARSLENTFTLLLPPGFPEPGRHRLELHGLRDGAAEHIESFGEVLID